MRLVGTVEVRNYANNERIQRCHSIVSLYSSGGQDFLLLRNPFIKGGAHYKITGNLLVDVVCRGKLTISVKEPTHELGIYNHAHLLQSFSNLVRCLYEVVGPSPIEDTSERRCSRNSVPAMAFLESLNDYAKLTSLSQNLKVLKLHHIEMIHLPESVTALQQLTHLEILDGCLSEIPMFVGNMPFLTTLNFPHNRLGISNKWEFLTTSLMRQNLRQLDLQNNEMEFVPEAVMELHRLFALHLDDNLLLNIPSAVREMRQLRVLTLSNNRIKIFPYNLFPVSRYSLDLTSNPIISHYFLTSSVPTGPYVPTLKELAGRAVIDYRVPVPVEETPKTLIKYLNTARYCEVCTGALFENHFPCRYISFYRVYVEIAREKDDVHTLTNARNVCSRRCMQPDLKYCEVLSDLTPEQYQGMISNIC